MMALWLCVGVVVTLPQQTAAANSLSATALFADGAVLQTSDEGGAGARITGTAAAGEEITLTGLPSAKSLKSTADASGQWAISFNASSSAAPVTLTLSGSKSTGSIVANNVLIGDL